MNLVPKGSIDNGQHWLMYMSWCQAGDKQLAEPKMTEFIDVYMHH